jgi:hypothetical protein
LDPSALARRINTSRAPTVLTSLPFPYIRRDSTVSSFDLVPDLLSLPPTSSYQSTRTQDARLVSTISSLGGRPRLHPSRTFAPRCRRCSQILVSRYWSPFVYTSDYINSIPLIFCTDTPSLRRLSNSMIR